MLAGFTRSIQRADFFLKVDLARVIPSSTPGVFDTSTSKGPEAFFTASVRIFLLHNFLCSTLK